MVFSGLVTKKEITIAPAMTASDISTHATTMLLPATREKLFALPVTGQLAMAMSPFSPPTFTIAAYHFSEEPFAGVYSIISGAVSSVRLSILLLKISAGYS